MLTIVKYFLFKMCYAVLTINASLDYKSFGMLIISNHYICSMSMHICNSSISYPNAKIVMASCIHAFTTRDTTILELMFHEDISILEVRYPSIRFAWVTNSKFFTTKWVVRLFWQTF